VKIFGEPYDVIAEVGSIRSMSAHGDYEDLLMFMRCQDASKIKKLFLVHGEYDVQQKFAERLKSHGYNVAIPGMHDAEALS
jgi:metallo-beta-lactamase family protein